MLASPARLYMPHLFTHCSPTIICVMLMCIALYVHVLMLIAFLCLYITFPTVGFAIAATEKIPEI